MTIFVREIVSFKNSKGGQYWNISNQQTTVRFLFAIEMSQVFQDSNLWYSGCKNIGWSVYTSRGDVEGLGYQDQSLPSFGDYTLEN